MVATYANTTYLMSAVAEDTPSVSPPNLERILLAQADQWLAQCHTFRQWYRQNFV